MWWPQLEFEFAPGLRCVLLQLLLAWCAIALRLVQTPFLLGFPPHCAEATCSSLLDVVWSLPGGPGEGPGKIMETLLLI